MNFLECTKRSFMGVQSAKSAYRDPPVFILQCRTVSWASVGLMSS